MKILITGATGLVGQALGQALVRRGHTLVVLSRQPESAQFQFPCAVMALNACNRAVEGCQAIIHLAGESIAAKRWSAEQKKRILDSRVVTARHLHEALRRNQGSVEVFITASGVGYYGDRADEILLESSPPGNDFLAEVCRQWEHEAWAAADVAQRQVALRTGMVLAANGGAMASLLPLFRRGLGGRLGSGHQWMSWIHLNDLVDLYIYALENTQIQGPINAVAHPVTNRVFTRTLAEVLGKPAFFAVPRVALQVALGEMRTLLLSSQRAQPAQAEKNNFHFRSPELTQALEDVCR